MANINANSFSNIPDEMTKQIFQVLSNEELVRMLEVDKKLGSIAAEVLKEKENLPLNISFIVEKYKFYSIPEKDIEARKAQKILMEALLTNSSNEDLLTMVNDKNESIRNIGEQILFTRELPLNEQLELKIKQMEEELVKVREDFNTGTNSMTPMDMLQAQSKINELTALLEKYTKELIRFRNEINQS